MISIHHALILSGLPHLLSQPLPLRLAEFAAVTVGPVVLDDRLLQLCGDSFHVRGSGPEPSNMSRLRPSHTALTHWIAEWPRPCGVRTTERSDF